jgi:DNA-binding MarR family transcriptional regulator
MVMDEDRKQASTDGGTIPPASDSLGELLLDIAPRIMRLEAVRLGRLAVPLTHRQYRILQRVSQGVTSPTRISRAANISLAAISESVDALARRGLVTRDNDETDRRASRLRVTPDGEVAFEAARAAISELAEEIAEGISDQRRARARTVLTAVFGNVRDGLNRADGERGSRPAAPNDDASSVKHA